MISDKNSPLRVAWREFWRKSRVGFSSVMFTPGREFWRAFGVTFAGRESDRYFKSRQADKTGTGIQFIWRNFQFIWRDVRFTPGRDVKVQIFVGSHLKIFLLLSIPRKVLFCILYWQFVVAPQSLVLTRGS